jgi:hypothetical protein
MSRFRTLVEAKPFEEASNQLAGRLRDAVDGLLWGIAKSPRDHLRVIEGPSSKFLAKSVPVKVPGGFCRVRIWFEVRADDQTVDLLKLEVSEQ